MSDLDLVVDLDAAERERIRCDLTSELAADLSLKVSVHGKDSLLHMSLEDSRILNIGEFIAKARRADGPIDYFSAKILLMLLRIDPRERYQEVAERYGTPEARRALGVKLGEESTFTPEMAAGLAAFSNQQIAVQFVEECLVRSTSQIYARTIAQRVRKCVSIDHWLQDYLLDKMGITSL